MEQGFHLAGHDHHCCSKNHAWIDCNNSENSEEIRLFIKILGKE